MQNAIDEIVHGPDVARQMRRQRDRAVTPPAPGDVYVELADMPEGSGFIHFYSQSEIPILEILAFYRKVY